MSTEEGLARRRALASRRAFVGGLGATAAASAFSAACAAPGAADEAAEAGERVRQGLYKGPPIDIGIVGAGLAGLVCADQLRLNCIRATLYEGNNRVGGRQYSHKGLSPGQTIELGGEPGQFTSIAGNEGKPVGNLYFAGEHCDSFYNQQGFMEGALCSGIDTAAAILTAAQKG